MALAAAVVIVTVLALAVGLAVLSAIAAAIEVLPSHAGSGSEPIEDAHGPATGAGARVSHES